MSILVLRVPHETGRLLSSIGVPGDKESVDTLHITLLDLGDTLPIEQLAKVMVATYEVTSQWKPFLVGASKVSTFN